MAVDLVLAQKCVDMLNDLYARDPKAAHALVETRVLCNEAVRTHPTIQCHEDASVGILGVMNGLCGVFDSGAKQGYGAVVALFSSPGGPLRGFYLQNEDGHRTQGSAGRLAEEDDCA